MGNDLTLQFGAKQAQEAINRHILNKIMVPLAKDLLQRAIESRIQVNNMTGNTINSYAVGIYVKGQLVWIETSAGSIPRPLRHKLNAGQKYYAGQIRWDGEEQEHTFTAKVSTNGTTEAERSIALLKEYQASSNSWTLVVCNGVEYATYEEQILNDDTLTGSFLESQADFASHLTVMTD